MIKYFTTLLLCLILSIPLVGKEKTDVMIFGHVVSVTTNDHIPYATIQIKGTKYGTIADGTGHFKLVNIPEGKHIITAKAVGYKMQEQEIEVKKKNSLNVYFELDDDPLQSEEIVVTATRSEHILRNVPVRTEIISSSAIEAKNAANLYEALEGTPGVRVENQCQYCNFTMVRMQGLGAEHTQVLIDGQPMYSGLAGVYGLQQLSTVDIDKIEVVKGAGSALYGSGAVAGAINIVSKEPSLVPQTNVDIQMGDYNTNKYSVSSSMRNERGNIGLGIFAQRYTEGAIDQTGEGKTLEEVNKKDEISDRVMTNLTNAGFSLFVDNPFFDTDKLILKGKSVFEKREGGTMKDDYFRNPLTDGTESITTDRYEASMQYNAKLNDIFSLDYTLAFINHNRNATNDSYLNDYMDTHNGAVPDLRNMRPYLANENSLTSTLSMNANFSNHNIIVGAQFFYDKLSESGMYVVVDTASSFLGESYRSTADKHAREIGFFAQDEWAVTEDLMVVPGVRFDMHKSGEAYKADKQVFTENIFPETEFSETAINPRLAVKYSLTDKITIRANAGTGFRAPYGFSEDLHLCSGSPRVWKSSSLKPETSISYNLSADYFGSRMRISANLFRTDLKDKIGFVSADEKVSALGYDYQWKNIDDAFVQGVELSFMMNIFRNLDMGLDFTYNQGEYKNVREDWVGTDYEADSKYISRFPQTTGNFKLEYKPRTWVFSLAANLQGSMYIDYFNEDIDEAIGDQSKIKKTDNFVFLNAKVSKKFNTLKIYAGVNNIMGTIQDEKHLDDAAFIYAPLYGRMFYAGVSLDIFH